MGDRNSNHIKRKHYPVLENRSVKCCWKVHFKITRILEETYSERIGIHCITNCKKLTFTYSVVFLHKIRHVTFKLITVLTEIWFVQDHGWFLSPKLEKWDQKELPFAANLALSTAALNTTANRPRGTLEILDGVLIATGDLWKEEFTNVIWKNERYR